MTEDSIIAGLYAAANGRIGWAQVLGDMAALLDLWLVQLVSVDPRTGRLLFTAYGGKGGDPAIALDYIRFFHTIDPRVPLQLATAPDQWMLSHEHHDDAFVAANAFYRDFLTPHGGGHMAGTQLLGTGSGQFMLALVGGYGTPPPATMELDFLEQLKYHFSEALKNFVHLRESRAELDMARQLLDQFAYPMLLVDSNRGIWHRNARAQALLDEGALVFEERGYLACRDRKSDASLVEAIGSLRLSNPPAATVNRRRALSVRHEDGSSHLAFVSAVRPDETMGVFGQVSGALVVLHDPASQRAGDLDPFIVAECFDLTPAEARVAVQLAAGANAKQIAQRSGAALPTVRTHVQRVLEKAGVTRQTDLIRVLLELPARATSR